MQVNRNIEINVKHLFIYVFFYLYLCLFMHAFIYLFFYVYIYSCIYLCMHLFVYSCIYLYMHLFIYLYIYFILKSGLVLHTCMVEVNEMIWVISSIQIFLILLISLQLH